MPKNITIMFKLIISVFRRFYVSIKFFGRHKSMFLAPPVVAAVLVLWPTCWWFAVESSRALLPPQQPRPPTDQSLQHFRRNRSLQHYMAHIQVLIEPSSTQCGSPNEVPVIIMVTSAPSRFDQRHAVRDTWAKLQPTYFAMGLHGHNVDENLVDNYIEAKQYGDLIVFDFRDHYQNLTLKTALMMKWTLDRCPQAHFMFKTDDDVLVNPWTLRKVIKENSNAQLLGYSNNDTHIRRRNDNKWYIPRWLFYENGLPKYLSGAGYLINGVHIQQILKKAYEVPLINIEDIYFTYLVAHKKLGLTLKHDRRLNPFKPWLQIGCIYWGFALMHGFDPEEMLTAWSKIQSLVDRYDNTESVCRYFSSEIMDFGDLLLH